MQVQQEALNLAQTQLDQDKQRVQIGTLAILSVQQDESQVAQSQANLIAAQSTLDTDQNTLKNLLTDSYSQWHDVDIQPTATLEAPLQSFDLQDSWSKGMTERPDLLQAKLNVERAGHPVEILPQPAFPRIGFDRHLRFQRRYPGNYNGTFNQFSEGNAPFYSYGAEMTMPLSNVGPRNQYKSTKATLQQIVLQLKQLEQNVMVEIDNAVKTGAVRLPKRAGHAAGAHLRRGRARRRAENIRRRQGHHLQSAALSKQPDRRPLAGNPRARQLQRGARQSAAQEGSTLEQYNINLEAK